MKEDGNGNASEQESLVLFRLLADGQSLLGLAVHGGVNSARVIAQRVESNNWSDGT
jgi:hypothetical protein